MWDSDTFPGIRRNLALIGLGRKRVMTEIASDTVNSEDIVFRPAGLGDIRPLIAYKQAIFRDNEFLITQPKEYRGRYFSEMKWILQRIGYPGRMALVAVKGRKIIGLLDNWTDGRARVSHVTAFGMSIAVPYRHQGIGGALLDDFIARMRARKELKKIELHVHVSNSIARRLYESRGFIVEGIRKDAIKVGNGRYIDDILMGLWLG